MTFPRGGRLVYEAVAMGELDRRVMLCSGESAVSRVEDIRRTERPTSLDRCAGANRKWMRVK